MAPSARSLGAAFLATAGNSSSSHLPNPRLSNIVPAASPLSVPSKVPFTAQVGGDVALRILPIGDSITYGSDDAPSAYRAALAELLKQDGNPVEYVGTDDHGPRPHSAVEASADDATIDDIYSRAESSLAELLPNIVLLNTGTADCKNGAEPEDVTGRVRELLQLSWSESKFSSVVLSTIISRGDDEKVEECVQEINKGLEALVQEQQDLSRKAVYVDFGADIALDDQGFPTEEGYEAMAGMWFDGIDDAAKRGWVESPEETAPPEVPGEEEGTEEEEKADEEEEKNDDAKAPSTTAPPEEAPSSTSVTDDAVDDAVSRVLSGSDPIEGQNKRRQLAGTSALPEPTAPPASTPTE